jgi:DNA polymerase elongation subunit (family B)
MSFYTNVVTIGGKVYLREIDNSGRRVERKVDYKPNLFLKSKNPNSKYKTLHGLPVDKIQQDGIYAARAFVKRYKDIEGIEVYGNTQFTYPFISDTFSGEIEYDPDKLNICNIDIEVECENGFPEPVDALERVNAITMKMHGVYVVLGIGDWEHTNPDLKDHRIKYYKCTDELALLTSFLNIWENSKIDIVTGWNVNQFDMTYLVNRLERLLGHDEAVRLSPWRIVDKVQKNIRGMMQNQVKILGLAIIDYLDLYRKFTYVTRETYRLDHIAEVELGERKIDHSEFAQMHLFYKQDYQKFIDYNIKDVELVDKLEDKLKLMELLITIAYQSKINFDDVFSPIRTWDALIFEELKRNNIVIPNTGRGQKADSFAGAYVKEPDVGEHDWVVSFDLNSLYPHLIMQYNISPETLIEGQYIQTSVDSLLEGKTDTSDAISMNAALCPSGILFSKEKKGFLPKLMQNMYDSRTVYKKEMLRIKQLKENGDGDAKLQEKQISALNNKQMAAKILLNSCYGALGNQYFRYFDIRQAESITLSGQLSIRWIEEKMNAYLNGLLKNEKPQNYVIASDTDSIYVGLGDFVNRFFKGKDDKSIVDYLDKIANDKFEPFISSCYQELADKMNAYEQKMQMAREVIASKGIWTAKKRYILNVHDNEGVRYASPQLKIMGLEAVRSSTPAVCREKIKETLKIIMNKTNDDLIEFVANFRKEFNTYDVETISFPRGVNGLTKYHDSMHVYKKGTPIHVKGVLFYNKLVKEHNLGMQYPLIKNSDKIKFCYLKEPNPIQNNAIAISTNLPTAFGLDKYIDRELQFDKAYLEPIKTITDTINWHTEKQFTLDQFF